jgi:hypothetical protein
MKALLFVAFLALLSGCWGSNEYMDLRGKVIDEKTNELIPNRKILVQELIDFADKNKPVIQGEFAVDETGHFSYRLKKSKFTYIYNFQIVGDSAYAYSDNVLGMTELDRDGKFLSMRMRRLTSLNIKIERKTTTAFSDTLFLSWQSDRKDGEALYPYKILNFGTAGNIPLRWVGKNIKSIVKTKVFADKKVVLHWELFRHGRPTEFADTIFCRRGVENSISFKY